MPKILSIDYGTKNIGLALSDDEQKFAFPYNTLTVNNKQLTINNKIISDIKNICKIEDVERVVVGMPINLSGEKTKTTEVVFNFVKELENALDVPVEVEDERLTTMQALRMRNSARGGSAFGGKNARNQHELSAQILLQSWLDKFYPGHARG